MKQPRARSVTWYGALTWLALVLLAALLAPASPSPPDLLHTTQPPFQPEHWWGTDPQGLDVGLTLLQGARTLLLISLPAALGTLLLAGVAGTAAGLAAHSAPRLARAWLLAGAGAAGALVGLLPAVLRGPGPWGGSLLATGLLLGLVLRQTAWGRRTQPLPLDGWLMGLMAFIDSIPLLLLVLVVAAVHQPTPAGLVLLLVLTCWTTPARVLRAATLQVAQQEYVLAARMNGFSGFRVAWRHVWPNCRWVLLVRLPLTVAVLMGLETTLSFLGVGLPPDTPSWGRLLAGLRLAPTAWWLWAWPGTALALTIISLHRLSNQK